MTQASWPPAGQGWGAPMPPRRGGSVRTMVLTAALVVAGGVLALAAVAVWSRVLSASDPTASAPATTAVTQPSATDPAKSPSTGATTVRPTLTPSASVSASPSPSTQPVTLVPLPTPSGVGTPNAKPGALPEPRTLAQARQWLNANAIYPRKVKVPTTCGLPLIDPARISAAELQKHLTRVAGCLTMVWRPALRTAGFSMPYPVVTVYSGAAASPCGKLDAYNAYYCAANQRIYFGRVLYEILPERDYAYDLILAHEYGHAVQARTGLLTAGWWYRYVATSKAKANEYARRLELQADCLAGSAMNALARATALNAADRKGFAEVPTAIADDTLTGVISQHGSAKARTRWLALGLGTSAIKACKTFTASADKVR